MKVYSRSEWELRMKCPYCISEIGVQMGDVKYAEHLDISQVMEVSYYATCIVCSGSIVLPENRLPSHVREAARNRYRGTPASNNPF